MVHIIRTSWQGLSGGLGLTQLAIDYNDATFGTMTTAQAGTATAAVRKFWDDIKGVLPNELNLTVSPVVDNYSAFDGELVGSVSSTVAPTSVLGTSAAAFSMAAGVKLNLNTGVIRGGRRVRGTVFIVPAAGAFSLTGTTDVTAKTVINSAGNALMTSLGTAGLRWVVWSRPIPADKPKGPREGVVSPVSAIETSEKTAVLRGRRD